MEIVTAVLAAVFCVSGVFLITLSILMPGDAEASRSTGSASTYGGHSYSLPAGANGNGANGHDAGTWSHTDHGGYVWQPGQQPPGSAPEEPPQRPSEQPAEPAKGQSEERPFIDEPLEDELERELA